MIDHADIVMQNYMEDFAIKMNKNVKNRIKNLQEVFDV